MTIIDTHVKPNTYYEISAILKGHTDGIKTGLVTLYCGDTVISKEEIAITVDSFWMTIKRYIKTGNADRLRIELNDVMVLTTRVAYFASNGTWRVQD